jgi:ubiquitin-conjugating enzyme E2 Q
VIPFDSTTEIEQDPFYTAKTSLNLPIGIPESAMLVSRAFRTHVVENTGTGQSVKPGKSHKRRKRMSSNDMLDLLQTVVSDDEDPDDINFLFSEDDSTSTKVLSKKEALVTL